MPLFWGGKRLEKTSKITEMKQILPCPLKHSTKWEPHSSLWSAGFSVAVTKMISSKALGSAGAVLMCRLYRLTAVLSTPAAKNSHDTSCLFSCCSFALVWMDLRVPLKLALGLSWWDVNEQLALIPKGYLFSNPEMMHFCKMMTWNHPFTSQHTEESSWAEGRVWQGKWLNCLILTENKTLKSVPKQNFHKNNWAPASKDFIIHLCASCFMEGM